METTIAARMNRMIGISKILLVGAASSPPVRNETGPEIRVFLRRTGIGQIISFALLSAVTLLSPAATSSIKSLRMKEALFSLKHSKNWKSPG